MRQVVKILPKLAWIELAFVDNRFGGQRTDIKPFLIFRHLMSDGFSQNVTTSLQDRTFHRISFFVPVHWSGIRSFKTKTSTDLVNNFDSMRKIEKNIFWKKNREHTTDFYFLVVDNFELTKKKIFAEKIRDNNRFALFYCWKLRIHEKNSNNYFFWKNSWKQNCFALFGCWPHWSHEKKF